LVGNTDSEKVINYQEKLIFEKRSRLLIDSSNPGVIPGLRRVGLRRSACFDFVTKI